MREAELRQCQIQEWYPIFKPYTIHTLFHPLPDSFLRYLQGLPLGPRPEGDGNGDGDGDGDSDGDAPAPFLLPVSVSGRDPLPRPTAHLDPVFLLDSETSFTSSDDDDPGEASVAAGPSFPELEVVVERSIMALGGAAFPKLNWSAPKDAAWISADGTLRCTSFADVALLLRSSDAIVHDFSHALSSCHSSDRDMQSTTMTTFYLALRKWYLLMPNHHHRKPTSVRLPPLASPGSSSELLAWEPTKSLGDRRFRWGPSDAQVSALGNSRELEKARKKEERGLKLSVSNNERLRVW